MAGFCKVLLALWVAGCAVTVPGAEELTFSTGETRGEANGQASIQTGLLLINVDGDLPSADQASCNLVAQQMDSALRESRGASSPDEPGRASLAFMAQIVESTVQSAVAKGAPVGWFTLGSGGLFIAVAVATGGIYAGCVEHSVVLGDQWVCFPGLRKDEAQRLLGEPIRATRMLPDQCTFGPTDDLLPPPPPPSPRPGETLKSWVKALTVNPANPLIEGARARQYQMEAWDDASLEKERSAFREALTDEGSEPACEEVKAAAVRWLALLGFGKPTESVPEPFVHVCVDEKDKVWLSPPFVPYKKDMRVRMRLTKDSKQEAAVDYQDGSTGAQYIMMSWKGDDLSNIQSVDLKRGAVVEWKAPWVAHVTFDGGRSPTPAPTPDVTQFNTWLKQYYAGRPGYFVMARVRPIWRGTAGNSVARSRSLEDIHGYSAPLFVFPSWKLSWR